jgi:large subunit ribosomal protein L9
VSAVKLILIESIHRLGQAGDLVSVKPGFARNFLLPQGKAILATEGRVRELEHNKRIAEEKAAKEMKDLQLVKQKLEALEIEIAARAGESGKLFGSVTAAQVAERVEAAGFGVDRRRIELAEPIKEVGEHTVRVRLLRQLVAELTVKVVADASASPEEEFDDERERERERRRDRDRDDEDDDDSDRNPAEGPSTDE